jgi:hypothetical protein
VRYSNEALVVVRVGGSSARTSQDGVEALCDALKGWKDLYDHYHHEDDVSLIHQNSSGSSRP